MRTFDSADVTRPPSRRTALARHGRAARGQRVVLCAPAYVVPLMSHVGFQYGLQVREILEAHILLTA